MAKAERAVGGKRRDRRLERRWRRIVGEHQRSGLTIRQFCRRGKLRETAFYFRRRELQRRQAEQGPSFPRANDLLALLGCHGWHPQAACPA